jgi:hypothetical protein
MNIITKIIYPNKIYEDVFRKINADKLFEQIFIDADRPYGCKNSAKTNKYVSLLEFFTFREKLINEMNNNNIELTTKRYNVFYSQEHNWGFEWISGVFEDTYNIKIKIDDLLVKIQNKHGN